MCASFKREFLRNSIEDKMYRTVDVLWRNKRCFMVVRCENVKEAHLMCHETEKVESGRRRCRRRTIFRGIKYQKTLN